MTRAKPDSCVGCACASHGTDFSAIEGTGSLGVMLVGEASGEMEARDGLPFRPYAPAGSLLERVLRRMSLSREQFSITNACRCRPRNNWLDGSPWEYSALNHCRPNLDQAIRERRPRAIVALGGIATRELTGLAGDARGVSHLAGYVVPGPDGIPVVPNFHPSFLRRGKASYQGVFARILQRAVNVAAGKDTAWMWGVVPEDKETHGSLRYQVRPSVDEARSYSLRIKANGGLVISYDIETGESASLDEDAREGFADTAIRLVQFSTGAGDAIAFPWEDPYRAIATEILHSPNVKCGHNVWLFDNKVLAAAGAREGLDLTPRGTVHDTLQMFHHWQPDLPAHLQFAASFVQFPFPWKHLAGTDIEFYGCCDVDATLRLYGMLEATLRRDGIWGDDTTGYLGQVYHVRPVLAAMEDRGLPVDDAARRALDAEFDIAQREVGAEITGLAADVGRVHPKEGYKGVPPEVKKLVDTLPYHLLISEQIFTELGDDGEIYRYQQREFAVPTVDAASGAPVAIPTLRWCRVYDFNPNSSQQLLAYMRLRRHPVPKSKDEDEDGNRKDTTNKKELQRLTRKTGDTFYLKVIEYRELSKARGTYVDGFKPGPDGCVHTTFTFDTAIGQLSSRNPNIQNFPKHGRLAKALRRMIAAKPGKILTAWDYKSCHVITLGFLAEDLNYLRMGRLDIHSFVAGHFLNEWDGFKIFGESDEELLSRFKWLKSDPARKMVRDDQAKHGILGIGNGLKAKGLYERYMESFPPRPCGVCAGTGRVAGVRTTKKCATCGGTGQESGARIAERVLEVAEALFPKVFAWQKRIQRLAHEQQYLRTEFGHIRRFFEVFRWDSRRGEWGHGDQSEEAIAFWLANIAHSHVREMMKELHRRGLDEKYGMCDQIHDDLSFHFDARLLDEHVAELFPILTAPSRVLRHPRIAPEGLAIGVEASAGPHWAEMSSLALPAFHPPENIPTRDAEPVIR